LGISLNFCIVSVLAERGGTKSVSALTHICQTNFSCSSDNFSTEIIFKPELVIWEMISISSN
jgi:hypothetical protein